MKTMKKKNEPSDFGTWYYRPFKVINKKYKISYYCIKEFFPTKRGEGGWTELPCYPCGDTMKELIQDLEWMLEAAKKGNIKEEIEHD